MEGERNTPRKPGIRHDLTFGLNWSPPSMRAGDGVSVFDIVEELIAQVVDDGHRALRSPDLGEDGAGGCQGARSCWPYDH